MRKRKLRAALDKARRERDEVIRLNQGLCFSDSLSHVKAEKADAVLRKLEERVEWDGSAKQLPEWIANARAEVEREMVACKAP